MSVTSKNGNNVAKEMQVASVCSKSDCGQCIQGKKGLFLKIGGNINKTQSTYVGNMGK